MLTLFAVRKFEGHEVEVDYENAHISEALLISAAGGNAQSLWLQVDGEDVILPLRGIRHLSLAH